MTEKVHIALLGDSIFDNKVYVGNKRSVYEHLAEKVALQNLPWTATLVAVDGNVTKHVEEQLKRVPKDATRSIRIKEFILQISSSVLEEMTHFEYKVSLVGEALLMMSTVRDEFKENYTKMIDAVLSKYKKVTICTIYNPNFGIEPQQTVATMGLTALNDVIVETAVKYQLPLIDLKSLFNSKEDYANPIEPSEKGGDKITNIIIKIMKEHNFSVNQCRIYA